MLNSSAINIALSLTASQRIRVAPSAGSLLNSVVTTATPVSPVKTDDELLCHLVSVTSNLMNTDLPTASQHTLINDSIVESVAPLLKGHIDFARNTGKSMVQECYEALTQRFSKQTARPASEAFTVQQHALPVVLEHGMVEHLIKSEPEKITIPNAGAQLGMPAYDRVKLIDFLTQGGKSFNAAVAEWVLTIPDDVLLQAWRSYFIGGTSGSVQGDSYMFEGDAIQRLTVGLLVLLWSNRFVNQLPEDYRGVSGLALDRELERLKLMSITVIRDAVKALEQMVSAGNFVLSYDRRNSTLRVLAPTYQSWLQAGGDVTVLLGMMASNEIVMHRASLDQRAPDLLRNWALYEATTIRLFEENRANVFQDIAAVWFLDSLGSLSVEEVEYHQQNPAYAESVKQRGLQYIRGRKLEDFQDLTNFALELVAQIRLGFTAAYPMLKGIDNARRANPKLEVREAAILAAVDYVAAYLADQVTVVA